MDPSSPDSRATPRHLSAGRPTGPQGAGRIPSFGFRASGKPFTDEEYNAADAEDKSKMDDYAEFCAYLAEREAMDEEELDEEGYFID